LEEINFGEYSRFVNTRSDEQIHHQISCEIILYKKDYLCIFFFLTDTKIQATKVSLEQHLKDRMIKIARPEYIKPSPEIQKFTEIGRKDIYSLDISNPILMTSTLNPNDMDGHR
jgi:hypothetical protein